MSRCHELPFARLDYENWPEDIRAAWHKAYHGSGVSDGEATPRKALGILFGMIGPKQPTLDDIESLFGILGTTFSQSTVITYLYDMYRGACLLWPSEDWKWLQDYIHTKRKVLWANNPHWKIGQSTKSTNPRSKRRSLDIDDWPDEPQNIWRSLKAQKKGTGRTRRRKATIPLANLSDPYISRIERGMARWFLWAQKTECDPLPKSNTVIAWIESEKRHGSSSVSIASYTYELWRGMTLIWPDLDWVWLSDIAEDLADNAKPIRPKLSQSVTTSKLRSYGIDLMNHSFKNAPTEQSIIQFRDGLLILLLTEKPMRLKNLAALQVDDIEFDEFGGASLSVGKTKNKQEDFAYLSPELGEALTVWIDDFRSRLAPKADCQSIWIGRNGKPTSPKSLSRAISNRTKTAFGQSVSPHKFRNAVAQTLAHHAPENIGVASRLLGHKDGRSIAPYEGLARAAGAANLLDDILVDYTMPPPVRKRSKA